MNDGRWKNVRIKFKKHCAISLAEYTSLVLVLLQQGLDALRGSLPATN